MKGWYSLLLVVLVCLAWAFMLGVDRESNNELVEESYEGIPAKELKTKELPVVDKKKKRSSQPKSRLLFI